MKRWDLRTGPTFSGEQSKGEGESEGESKGEVECEGESKGEEGKRV